MRAHAYRAQRSEQQIAQHPRFAECDGDDDANGICAPVGA